VRERLEERTIPEALRTVNAANDGADREYVAGDYDGSAVLFRGSYRLESDSSDPTLGWRASIRGGLEIVDVPGSHFTLVEEPHVQVLARELAARIAALVPRHEALGPRTGEASAPRPPAPVSTRSR
jgi:thioesterase domain-containing protein